MDTQTVIIAGAGPGGLAAALALQQRGIKVEIYEAVTKLKPLGVGINLLPHSVAILHKLGLKEALERYAVKTSELRYTNKFGQLIWAEPRGLAAGYDYPQYSIHRGMLQMTLFEAVRKKLGTNCVYTGHKLEDWQAYSDHVKVQFRKADGSLHEVSGSCLIAADGIHSVARQKLYPNEGEPLYSGRVLWRSISQVKPFLDARSMIMAGHQDQKFVAYPISQVSQGLVSLNWIAELRVPNYKAPASEKSQHWNREVSKSRFAAEFEPWQFDWLNIPEVIEQAELIYEYPLVDRNPLDRWTYERITLLGDAAHPMYPIGSNGASQAILDADKVAECLAEQGNIQDALLAYEAARRLPTSCIVLSNRQNGPEQVMQMAEERAPKGFTSIHEVISRQELEEMSARYKQTAGFALSQVNKA